MNTYDSIRAPGHDSTVDGCSGVTSYDGLPDSHVVNCVGFTAPPWLLQTSVSFYYFQLGFIYSSWISRIPDTKAALDLSDGGLGMVLVCAVFGAMMGLPLVTWLVNSVGSAQSVLIGSLANAVLFPLAGVTWFGVSTLCVGVLGIGFSMAMIDVSMNAHAVCVEKLLKLNVLGMFQATNSFGSLSGVLIGGLFSAFGVPPFVHFVLVSICFSFVSVIFFHFLVHDEHEKILETMPSVKHGKSDYDEIDQCEDKELNTDKTCGYSTPMLVICFLGFVNLMGVGSVNDWSTVYFSTILYTTPFYTSMGYAFFITFQIIGQIASDWLILEYGPRNMLTYSGLLAFLGLGCVVLSPTMQLTCVNPYGPFLTAVGGFAIAGAGLSSIGPILVSQTGKLEVPGMTSAGKIGSLTACSYLGLLIGPPTFGGLSTLLGSLRWAMLVDAMLMFSITPLAGLAFKDAEYPRLMNVSYSTVFKANDVETSIESSISINKKKAVALQSTPAPEADMELKILM